MNLNIIKPVILITAGAVLASGAQAGVLFSFNFQDKNDTIGVESTSGSYGTLLESNLEEVVVSLGAGLEPQTYQDAMGAITKGTANATLTESLANNVYHTFTVAPSSGFEVTYSSLDFTFSTQNGGELEVYSSADAFGSVLYSNPAIGTGGTGTSATIDLSGLGTLTEPVEFRFYSTAGSNWGTQRGFGVGFAAGSTSDDLVLNGTVSAVPEPGTFALLAGFGAIALVLLRRRVRNS